MVTNRAAADLKAVKSHVVLSGQNLTDLFFFHQPLFVFGNSARERIVGESPSSVLGFFKKWKVYHPAESEQIGVVLIFAQIRPVGTILLHRLFVSEAGERNLLDLFLWHQNFNDLY